MLQIAGNECWHDLNPDTLRAYVEALQSAVDNVRTTAFFFNKDDFQQLQEILEYGLNYRIGKKELLEMRLRPERHSYELDENERQRLRQQIERNREYHESFGELIKAIHEKYSKRVVIP